jgi:hypothetical protein
MEAAAGKSLLLAQRSCMEVLAQLASATDCWFISAVWQYWALFEESTCSMQVLLSDRDSIAQTVLESLVLAGFCGHLPADCLFTGALSCLQTVR